MQQCYDQEDDTGGCERGHRPWSLGRILHPITPLKVPEAWVKGVRPNHPGLQEDIKNGSTLAAMYQTAEVQEIADEEENPEPGLKSPFGKRRKSGALNL